MNDDEITFETLCKRYPPEIAEFLIKEIEKADRNAAKTTAKTPVQDFLAKAVKK